MISMLVSEHRQENDNQLKVLGNGQLQCSYWAKTMISPHSNIWTVVSEQETVLSLPYIHCHTKGRRAHLVFNL